MIVLPSVKVVDQTAIAKIVPIKKTMKKESRLWMLFWTETLMLSSLKSNLRKASIPKGATVKSLAVLRNTVNVIKVG